MQATAHSCIWTVTHRPLPPSATAASGASHRRTHHDSATDFNRSNEKNDDDPDQATVGTPEWIHPPTSVYTLGTHRQPSLPASHHPNHAWLATSAALHNQPGRQTDPLGSPTTRSTLALLESMLLNRAARPLALHWVQTAGARGAVGRNTPNVCVHMPLDTGVLVRLSIKVNPWVPVTDLTDIVLDARLAESRASSSVKTVGDEYRNWSLATKRHVESVQEAATRRVAANLAGSRHVKGRMPNRWGAAVVAPHFIACHVPAEGKIRVFFSVNRHKLVRVERKAMGSPTMVEVDVGKDVGGSGVGDGVGGGKVKLQTVGEHLAAIGERSIAMYQIRETSGVIQVSPTSTLAFSTDLIRMACLSWGSTLVTVIQSSSPTLEGNTELWIRGYAFNTKSRLWEELDAHGPVLSLPAAETGDISAWTMGEPVLVGTLADDCEERGSADSVNRPVSTRSKTARAHAMSVFLGTSTGKLMHVAVQFTKNSVSWTQVELSHPVSPLAPSGIAHLAMHPGGCFIAAVDTLGQVAIVDLSGKPVSVRQAFTSSSTASADPFHPLQALGFNAPPSLVSWSPPPQSPLNPTAPLPGQRIFVPGALTPTPSTLLVVFDRGPFAALTFDFASTSTSLIGYAHHLLALGQQGWKHVMHLAKHLPLHSPGKIATLGHMLLDSIATATSPNDKDPMWESGAYHTQLLGIATRVLAASPHLESARALARKVVHAHLAHGRLDLALTAAASASGACSDLLHLVALCASHRSDARGLAAAAHFQFLKTCPGPYPTLLTADPMPAEGDEEGVQHATVEQLVEMYTRQVAPIAAGNKPAFGMDVKRLAAYLEVSGNWEEALRWWQRIGYDDEGRRGLQRVAGVVGWWEGKRRETGEGHAQ